MALHMDYSHPYADSLAEKYGETLFHYTSISSFKGIIDNKTLWLGNLKQMNDKSEQNHFIGLLQQAVNNRIADTVEPNAIKNFFKKVKTYRTQSNQYSFSFSRYSDDAAQWERYAVGATGVCLGFDMVNLANLILGDPCTINEVFYGERLDSHEHIDNVCAFLKNGDLGSFASESSLITNIVATSVSHKHPGFRSENEVRLAYLFKTGPMKLEYKDCGGRIRQFLILDLTEMGKKRGITIEDLISTITIGPRSGQDKEGLVDYLAEKGLLSLAGKVRVSDCPLR